MEGSEFETFKRQKWLEDVKRLSDSIEGTLGPEGKMIFRAKVEAEGTLQTPFSELNFPDDMYLRPLALVMQGNMLLGAKRK